MNGIWVKTQDGVLVLIESFDQDTWDPDLSSSYASGCLVGSIKEGISFISGTSPSGNKYILWAEGFDEENTDKSEDVMKLIEAHFNEPGIRSINLLDYYN